jgi:predicted transposase YdaD
VLSKYDDLVKRLGRLRPSDFVQWLCPEAGDIQKISFEDREFELTYRRVDLLYKVKSKDTGEFFLHLEFQVELKPDFSMRLHEYSTRVRREFGLPVQSVVVFLASTKAIVELEPVDRCELHGKLICEFHYSKIVLPAEDWQTIIARGLPALLPLVPLAKIPEGEVKQALTEAVSHVNELSDQKLQSELAAVLYLVGGYSYSEMVRQVIGEKLMKDLMESATYRELVETAQLKAKRDDLLRILRGRFRKVSKELGLFGATEKFPTFCQMA